MTPTRPDIAPTHRTRRGLLRIGLGGLAGGLAIGLLSGWAPVAQAADGPRGNLLVSWRVSGSGEFRREVQGIRPGQVTIDSRRGVSGRAGVEWSSQESSVDQHIEQQVMVLNGGRARLDVRQQRPVTQWQWTADLGGQGGLNDQRSLSSPQGVQAGGWQGGGEPRVGLVSQTVWVDTGQGLTVRPRWAGGRAPVVVELEAEAPVASTAIQGGQRFDSRPEDEGSSTRLAAQTTVSVPMGQWVAVASTRQQSARQQAGTWRSTDSGEADRAVLEIRVSQP